MTKPTAKCDYYFQLEHEYIADETPIGGLILARCDVHDIQIAINIDDGRLPFSVQRMLETYLPNKCQEKEG